MIEFVTGDMFADTEATAIAHGCNCRGLMGAGVAARVRDLYPDAYAAYLDACLRGAFQLGTALLCGKVWNLGTQFDPGPYARLDAIDTAVRAMMRGSADGTTIAMPCIGSGIGGLAWSDVKRVVTRACERRPGVLVRVYEWAADKRRRAI